MRGRARGCAGGLESLVTGLSALPRSPHGSEAGGDPRCCENRGAREGAGDAVEEQVGGEAAARRVREEPLPSHPAGERLCSSRAPGRVGWTRPAAAPGTVPDDTGRNPSFSLRRAG